VDWEHARELRLELRAEWDELWKLKCNDKFRAEGISSLDSERLFVEKGEVIYATKDYKPLSFREILERHLDSDIVYKIDTNPQVGGWRKFIKENIKNRKQKPFARTRVREHTKIKNDLSQVQRKRGAGWLNKARIGKKIKLNNMLIEV